MLNQLPGVGSKTTAKLMSAGVVSFTDVMCTELHVLERAAGRKPPFGDDLKSTVARLLNSTLSVSAEIDDEKKFLVCTIERFR